MTAEQARSHIEPSAIVEDGAELGEGVSVWHHAHVRAGAVIGRASSLGKNVFVDAGVAIGAGVRIQNNVSIYQGVELADEVFVGPSAVFTNDLVPRAGNRDWTPIATKVARGASIGANATVICGVTVGPWSLVGAGSVVTRDIRPYEIVRGNPAKNAGWLCQCGTVRIRSGDVSLVCGTCGTDETVSDE